MSNVATNNIMTRLSPGDEIVVSWEATAPHEFPDMSGLRITRTPDNRKYKLFQTWQRQPGETHEQATEAPTQMTLREVKNAILTYSPGCYDHAHSEFVMLAVFLTATQRVHVTFVGQQMQRSPHVLLCSRRAILGAAGYLTQVIELRAWQSEPAPLKSCRN